MKKKGVFNDLMSHEHIKKVHCSYLSKLEALKWNNNKFQHFKLCYQPRLLNTKPTSMHINEANKYSIPFRSHRENLEPTVSTDYEFRKCVVRNSNALARTCTHILELSFLLRVPRENLHNLSKIIATSELQFWNFHPYFS